jgi:phage anti-repressor protein
MSLAFSIQIAQNLIDSSEQFPVDFDVAWQWLDYSRKDPAKRFLIENFEEGVDFHISVELGSVAVPRPTEKILLTIDCTKMWGMMCGTAKGKEVRRYFLECERIAKKAITKPKTALELAKEQVKLLEQIELQNQVIADLETENEHLAEAVDELFSYSSIIRVAKFNNCSEKAFEWRKLKAASKAMGLEIKQVPCPRFQVKNLYSHDVWRFVYPEYQLPETTTLVIKA